jgi:hypothetical protein
MINTRNSDAMLARLLVLRLRGGMRHRWQELKTLRGLLFLCVTIAVIALLMRQTALPDNPLGGVMQQDPQQLRAQLALYMPYGLLAACLLTVLTSSGPAIHFSPSEINLLFTAPFSRAALLLYKMCFYVFGALLSALLITLLVPTFTGSLLATFLGAFLVLVFIQLFSAVLGLTARQLVKCCIPRLKRSHLFILLGVLVAAVFAGLSLFTGNLAEGLQLFQSSLPGRMLLAPFAIFTKIFTAGSVYPGVLGWALAGLAINIVLFGLIVRLDRHAYEASVTASLKLHQRWMQAKRSGLLWGTQPVVARTSRRPPVLGGIGPLAWRQLLAALRRSRKALLTFLTMALLAGPVLVTAAAGISVWSRIGFVFFVAVYVLPRTLVFDFRSDLETMENFKALPLRPWKLCVGQLVAPVLLTSLVELILLCSAAVFLEGTPRLVLLVMVPFLVPFNLLLYGLENLMFLLFPTPLVPVGRVDFDFLGRTMVEFSVKTALLLGGCGLAATAGTLVLNATGRNWSAFAVVTWWVLMLVALLLLPLMSRAYSRFDISRG